MPEPGWSMVLELAPRSVGHGRLEGGAGRGDRPRGRPAHLHRVPVRGAHPPRRRGRPKPGRPDPRGHRFPRDDPRRRPLCGGHHDPAPTPRATARLQRPRSEDVVLPVHDGWRAGPGQPRARRPCRHPWRPASARSSRRPTTCRRWASRSTSTSGPPGRRATSSTTWRSTATSSATSGRSSWPTTPMAASRPARSPRSRKPRSPAARSRSGSATSAPIWRATRRPSVAHEVFTLVGSGFVHVRAGLYVTLTHPLVRVAGAIPLRYRSGNWDVAWVFLRTDGQAQVRRIDPYSRGLERPSGAARLPLVRTVMAHAAAIDGSVNGHDSGPPDRSRNRSALKASCNLRPMLISHCPWSREGL